MRLIFAGTPAFACTALQRLAGEGFDLALVLTQPDRPAGRGMQLHASPVKLFAQGKGIPVAQPRSLRLQGKFPQDAQDARRQIVDAQAQCMVVAAYGLVLPQWLLDLMQHPAQGTGFGCLNIHASLLPRWRGAAPIHRAIEAGDAQTGVTIMQMDAGLDTGAMLLQQALAIRHAGPDADTTGSLQDRLAALGADLIGSALAQAQRGVLVALPQPLGGVSYAHKVEKAQAEVDWSSGTALIERRVRAFNPSPGAWTTLGGEVVKLWRTEPGSRLVEPGVRAGTVLGTRHNAIDVACGDGVLRLCELQKAGGKRMEAAAFLRGQALPAGMVFGRGAAGS